MKKKIIAVLMMLLVFSQIHAVDIYRHYCYNQQYQIEVDRNVYLDDELMVLLYCAKNHLKKDNITVEYEEKVYEGEGATITLTGPDMLGYTNQKTVIDFTEYEWLRYQKFCKVNN